MVEILPHVILFAAGVLRQLCCNVILIHEKKIRYGHPSEESWFFYCFYKAFPKKFDFL